MALMQSTRQSVSLTLHVISEDNDRISIFVYPLMSLTWLIMATWQLMRAVNQIRFEAVVLWLDFQAGCELIYVVTAIGFSAFAFAMGLRL